MKKDSQTTISQYIYDFSTKAERLGRSLIKTTRRISTGNGSLPAGFDGLGVAIEAKQRKMPAFEINNNKRR